MPSPDRHFATAAIFTQSTGLTPNSGDAALYIKTDNKAYIKDSTGAELPVASIGGSVGSVDNAILRADGTGGTILQNSGLIVDDAVVAYSVTGDAATDVITATGHNFTTNQTVLFSSITGGSGLSANTVYFVRNIVGNTFQLSTTSGGAAINFTTNITAGSIIAIQANVAISQDTTATDSSLVLTPKGTGALIAGPKPNGTATGGNARGTNAVDWQTAARSSAAQVASGNSSVISGGERNTASGSNSTVGGGYLNTASNNSSVISGGERNTASGSNSTVGGGYLNTASNNGNVVAGGINNTASGANGMILGGDSNLASNFGCVAIGWDGNTASGAGALAFGSRAVSDRSGMMSHANFRFSVNGDAQRARFVMRNKTTTNSAVELFLDGSSTRLTIPSGKYVTGTINIAGIKSNGDTAARYIRQFSIKNVALTTSLVGTVDTIGVDQTASTSISITADDPNDSLKVEVTGIAAETWRWVASVDVVEVAYGI